MKPRKTHDLRELTDDELVRALHEAQETLSNQKFQHALAQLQDTAYIHTLKRDIARFQTIIKERQAGKVK